uniref:Poly [ADP-ribose] polymerase n=1 Tax=Nothobranchius furzeri TaxID=105023 RepID=A0A8C6L2T1_NOTFU
MPDSFTVKVHPVIWKFLLMKGLLGSINDQMHPHFCSVALDDPEVELSPLPSLLRQKGLTAKDVAVWSKTAREAFCRLMSQYSAFECDVNTDAWKSAEKEVHLVVKEDAILVFDASKEVLIDLQHIGGLALAMLKAAGPQLQKISNDHVAKKGKVQHGDVVITDGFNLRCRKVFHAVCPPWDGGGGQAEKVRRCHEFFSVLVSLKAPGWLKCLFSLCFSGVSKAILDSAGVKVQQECSAIGVLSAQGYMPRAMILTSAGQLPSRNILHIVGQNDPSRIKEMVYGVLKFCEDHKFSSVAFPALGTVPGAPLPPHWEDMKGDIVKLFPVTVGTTEYNTVMGEITKNGLAPNVERVQNTTLWQSFQLLKKQMEVKNNHANNERLLFHGTASKSTDLINSKGFNRSYAGIHGAMYGKGSYFAVDPAYSAGNYAKPDSKGHKRMYQARVLVGDYTQGSGTMITPPAKSTNPADLYDSVTDRANNPSMFVVFNDIQAYPEYLITFT